MIVSEARRAVQGWACCLARCSHCQLKALPAARPVLRLDRVLIKDGTYPELVFGIP